MAFCLSQRECVRVIHDYEIIMLYGVLYALHRSPWNSEGIGSENIERSKKQNAVVCHFFLLICQLDNEIGCTFFLNLKKMYKRV